MSAKIISSGNFRKLLPYISVILQKRQFMTQPRVLSRQSKGMPKKRKSSKTRASLFGLASVAQVRKRPRGVVGESSLPPEGEAGNA